MSILKLIASNGFLTVNKFLAQKIGLNAAVLFADLAGANEYWRNKGETMFFRTREEITKETTLGRSQQIKANKVLIEKGLIKTVTKGVPAKLFYIIDNDCLKNLVNLLEDNETASRTKNERLEQRKTNDINNNKYNNKNTLKKEKEKPKFKKPTPAGYMKRYEITLQNYSWPPEIETRPELKEAVLYFFEHLDSIKNNFGAVPAVSEQIKSVLSWLKKGSTAAEIIEAIKETIKNGNVSYNPNWTKNRKKQAEQKKQRAKVTDDYAAVMEQLKDPNFLNIK
jgi:hypothetical protein